MWEMFDKIVCIHYLPNKGERWAKMTSEFERIGLLGSDRFQFEFTVPWFFSDIIDWKKKGTVGGAKRAMARQYTIQYYNLLKKCLYLGYDHILILEDDIVFRKDLGEIKTILDATPNDYDIVNYEPFRRKGWMGLGKGCWGKYYDLKGNQVNQNWDDELIMRYDSVVFDTGAVAYSKKALSRIVERIEDTNTPLGTTDWYLFGKNGEMGGLNLYCTTGNNYIGLQDKTSFTGKVTGDNPDNTIEHCYRGVDLSKFNFSEHNMEGDND